MTLLSYYWYRPCSLISSLVMMVTSLKRLSSPKGISFQARSKPTVSRSRCRASSYIQSNYKTKDIKASIDIVSLTRHSSHLENVR